MSESFSSTIPFHKYNAVPSTSPQKPLIMSRRRTHEPHLPCRPDRNANAAHPTTHKYKKTRNYQAASTAPLSNASASANPSLAGTRPAPLKTGQSTLGQLQVKIFWPRAVALTWP